MLQDTVLHRSVQVFLSERDTADRNHALAYFMRENKCFPRWVSIIEPFRIVH